MNEEYREVSEESLRQVIDAGKYAVGVDQLGNSMVTTFYRIIEFDHHYYVIGQKIENVHLNPAGREVRYYLNRMYFVEEE